MKLVRWKRFIWDLTQKPLSGPVLPPHFQVRPAGKEDQKAAREVVLSAFSQDSSWSDTLKTFTGRLEAQLEVAFARPAPSVLVVNHGQRVIAASLLATEIDADNHLLSGPCVLAEYRNRGIATALLWHSLQALEAAGVSRVIGICKETAPAARFVYRKFSSTSESCEFDPALVETR